MPKLATLILAAGESKRFGSCKHLVKIGKETFIEHQLSIAQTITPDHVAVVVGAYADEIKEKIHGKAIVFENKHWQMGIGSSLAHGVRQLQNYDGVLVLLADQVAIAQQGLLALRDRWFENTENIVCARYDNILGVPTIFPRKYYSEIFMLHEDVGAKHLIQRYIENTVAVDIPTALFDIDTLADLEKLA